MMPTPSSSLQTLDAVLAVSLAFALPFARNWAGRRSGESTTARRRATTWAAVGAFGWLVLTGGLAASGVLAQWERTPPPLLVLLVVSLIATIALACWKVGRILASALPLWALVGYQAFRMPVEFMLHRAYEEGVIGAQMTWSGRNFDVVSGASAVVLALWLRARGPERPTLRAVVWAWNVLGLALLVNIVTIAVLSMPTRLRTFDGPANSFVATFPFVWLPTVMVTAALFGHVLVTRRLLSDARSERERLGPA